MAVNKGSFVNYTALMCASKYGHLEIVRELCERGANVNVARTDNGLISLIWASLESHLEIFHELCERGADVNASRTDYGITALMFASLDGKLELVRELLWSRGANFIVSTKGGSYVDAGITALM